MADGGEGYWSLGYWSLDYWHTNWWAEATEALPQLTGEMLLFHWATPASGTKYYSNGHVRHPSRFYKGKITAFGSSSRAINIPPGLPRIGNITITLSNADLEFTNIRSSTVRGAVGTLYIGPEGGSFNDDFNKICEGVTVSTQINSAGEFVIHLMDFTFDKLNKYLESTVSDKTTVFTDLPDRIQMDYAPLIYGEVAKSPCQYVDTVGFRYVVAKHPVKSVDTVYRYGEVVASGYSVVEVDVGSETWTLLDFTSNQENVNLSNEFAITVDMKGATSNGLSGGGLITTGKDALVDYFTRYADISFTKLQQDSWQSVGTLLNARGWEISGGIYRRMKHEDVVTQILRSFNMDMFVNIRGLIDLKLFDVSEALGFTVPTMTETDLILEKSFSQEERRTFVNKYNYFHTRDHANGQWDGIGQWEDFTSQGLQGVLEDDIELWFVGDDATARDVVGDTQFFQRHVSDTMRFTVPAPEVLSDLELGSLVKITHEMKPGANAEPVKVIGLNFRFDQLVYQVEAIRTNLFNCHVFGSEADPYQAQEYTLATDEEKAKYWYLGSEVTGEFSDGDASHTFCL